MSNITPSSALTHKLPYVTEQVIILHGLIEEKKRHSLFNEKLTSYIHLLNSAFKEIVQAYDSLKTGAFRGTRNDF